MNSIAASPVLRPPQTRIAPALEEERTAAASTGDAQAPQQPKFSDVVAILNPLQNLPVVGTIYRKLTDDVPHPAARALGGLLWGGPLGLLGAVFSYVAEQVSGKSTTEIVKSLFDGEGEPAPAAAEPAGSAAPTADAAGAQPPVPPPSAQAPSPPAPASAAAATPAPAAAPPPQPAARASAGGHDLAYYQARAGMRLPPATTAVGPIAGPQAATPLPSLQRVAPPATAPATTSASAAAPTAAPVSPRDFMERMQRGIEQYQALSRTLDAQPRAPRLDRVE
jgi:hypothetical protein